ncbi:hypothetical protein E4U41_003104 [Claviceps citrina]|nr:hypothetical protein E4U41_003104 [Claviceps citrina]
MREKKKRGKASRKDLAERAAAQAAAVGFNPSGDLSDGKESSHSPNTDEKSDHLLDHARSDTMSTTSLTPVHDNGLGDNGAIDAEFHHGPSATSTPGHYGDLPDHPHPHMQHPIQITSDGLHGGRPMNMGGYTGMSTSYDRQSMASDDMMGGGQGYTTHAPQNSMNPYPDMAFGMMGQGSSDYHSTSNFRMSGSPMSGYPMTAAPSPAWAMPMSSPQSQFRPPLHSNNSFGHNVLRYPVLQPLLPHLSHIMPINLACDLIDFYFASSSSAATHPMSPYILASVFRRRAICHPTKPRKCQPALLASILWVAAQTSEAPLPPSFAPARGKICQKLLELTISLLKPLIHNTSSQPCSNPASSPTPAGAGAGLTSLGTVLPGSLGELNNSALGGEHDAFRACSQLDDLVTYIHLATVVSASEYKGSSLRWWNVAWSLARELKLGRELPPSELRPGFGQHDMDSDGLDEHDRVRNTPGFVTEEEREERRRVWWLVYIVDRHLALCYNRPLFLLDVECEGLRKPLDDGVWQTGDFPARPADADSGSSKHPSSGPQYDFRGYDIFGYFLPLMTILGEIVDLHHARNHPRFGAAFRASREWSPLVAEIRSHLESYEQSLKRFESRGSSQNNNGAKHESTGLNGYLETQQGMESHSPSAQSVHTTSSRITEAEAQTRTILAYGTHVMHVLHILLEGKWDPISPADDDDLWTSSPDFVEASGHAVAAAEAVGQILEYDPGLELMPFFFGVYLLQGSFLLLLTADKLQGEASPSVVRACETVVRAHDACVVTLNTDYQRKFSKVMRCALALVRGRIPEDLTEQLQRRRELLGLYRWDGDGTGLAL